MFGPAGSPVNYKGAAYKAPKYIKEEGLDSYEYQSPYGVRIGEKSAKILKEESEKHGDTPDQIISAPGGQYVKRNPSIAKRVLAINNYHCAIDSNHSTFQTRSDVPYMEAHHLIPCTVSNSKKFKEKSKLDREENIVCICPNCHRACLLYTSPSPRD